MSIFDQADLVPPAPTWRCPHCRTLQPEATRCRACSRAAVTCSTCHRYRRSVAADLGYCADDHARAPLRGDEVHGCWEMAPGAMASPGLFDDSELHPTVGHEPLLPPSIPGPVTTASDAGSVSSAEPLPPPGRLVDAPHVAPGRVLTSEMERRARGGHG